MQEVDMTDPLENLVDLEQQYFLEGRALGIADGERAGRSEGRQFGMQKGFEKFIELGRLNGWSRLTTSEVQKQHTSASQERLLKHLAKLKELTEIENVSTDNSEDGVADVDERLRDAKSKATLLRKLVGAGDITKSSSAELEDFGGLAKGTRARDQ